jgi:hypothetical protein
MQDIDLKTELSESDWIQSKSLNQLMNSRSRMTWFSAGTMMAMAVQLYSHVHTALIAAWLLVSLVVMVFRVHVKTVFKNHFLAAPVESQSAFVTRNQPAWTLNAFTWGVSGWLFFTNIPIENQYIGATILTFVGLVAVHNLNTHREISRQFLNLLMGTQVLGAVWYIAYIWWFQGPQLQYIHLLSLVVIWACCIYLTTVCLTHFSAIWFCSTATTV